MTGSKARRAFLRAMLPFIAFLGAAPVYPRLLQPPDGAMAGESGYRVTKTYPAVQSSHLTLDSLTGDVTVNTWGRREIAVKAVSGWPIGVREGMSGDVIEFEVTKPRHDEVTLEVFAPSDTCLQIKSKIGKVTVSGIEGHISLETIEGDIHMMAIGSPSVEARSICGDIYFDGKLNGQGPYTMESIKGDIDVSIPDGVAFDLRARSLADKINLGGFMLEDFSRGPKSANGRHDGGGPRLSLTASNGRILLHKK